MQSIVFYDSFTLTNYTEYQLFARSYFGILINRVIPKLN